MYMRNRLLLVAALFALLTVGIILTYNDPDAIGTTAKVGDAEIHYTLQGEGPNTMVFVHGWACDETVWRLQVPAMLKAGYRVLTLDLAGHGKSTTPDIPYTQELFADAVAAVMAKENISNGLLVVHSMGLQVAREFVARYPTKALGLVVVDGAYWQVPTDLEALTKWEKGIDDFMASLDTRVGFEAFVNSLFTEDASDELRLEILSLMAATKGWVAADAMIRFCDPALWEPYPTQIPTLALYAAMPELPADNDEYIDVLFPGAQYEEWEGVGHFLMMEKPDEFNEKLLTFAKTIF